MRIIINAITAKNVGGGYQGALNFIKKTIEDKSVEWFYIVSDILDRDLHSYFENAVGIRYFIFPAQPDFKHSYFKVRKQVREVEDKVRPDLIYTLLSPSYFHFKTTEVLRFANAWITNTNEYCWNSLSVSETVRMKINQWIQRWVLRDSRYFITQTETVKQGIMKMSHLPSNNVKVISNILPDIYKDFDNSHEDMQDGIVHIACIGGAMPHKDFRIVPAIVETLRKEHGIHNIKIHMTLPKESKIWQQIYSQLKRQGNENYVQTYGNISQIELAKIYRKCSISLMPSLLETFSVSSLESMYFGMSCVASDFSFYRDVMGNACLYFAPTSVVEASKQIAIAINNQEVRENLKKEAETQLQRFSDYDDFYKQTTDFLQKVVEENQHSRR